MPAGSNLILVDRIATEIVPLRGQRVILDRDLAALYDVPTGAFNRAVKRNIDRFPIDFMFQLTTKEQADLAGAIPHFHKLKFSKTPPYAFTEHGAIMAASVLNAPRAVEVSVLVVRAFVKLRELLFTHKELAKKFTELESRLSNHDVAIQQLLHAIRQLMDEPPAPPKPKIGFRV
jgi:ORF6N domain